MVGGGSAAAEDLDEEKDALELARGHADDQELELNASLFLQQCLESVDAKRASHLGRSLAKPVTDRFVALTENRYSQLSLDPDLRAEGITVAGSSRRIDNLSVGTREQLGTLLRLAIAAQLKTAVLLDDHLVQSDARRLEWFRAQLRSTVHEHDHQVIVLTCRPTDYISSTEVLVGDAVRHDSPDGSLTVIDLSQVVMRSGSDPEVLQRASVKTSLTGDHDGQTL